MILSKPIFTGQLNITEFRPRQDGSGVSVLFLNSVFGLSQINPMGQSHRCMEAVQLLIAALTSVTLTSCATSLITITSNNHYEGITKHTVDNVFILCAAVPAPAVLYLCSAIGQNFMLFIGSSMTCFSLLIGWLLDTSLKSFILFASLYGSGVSVLFLASIFGLSQINRGNNLFIVTSLYCLSALLLTLGQRIFNHVVVMLEGQLATIILASCVFFLNVVPNFALVFCQRKTEQNDKTRETYCGTPEQHIDVKANSVDTTVDESSYLSNASYLYLEDLKWRAKTFIWWGSGVNLALQLNTDLDRDYTIPVLMCIFSLTNLGYIMIQTRKNVHNSVTVSPLSYFFSVCLLGISGINISYFSNLTNALHHALVFSVGVYLQLIPTAPESSFLKHIETREDTSKTLPNVFHPKPDVIEKHGFLHHVSNFVNKTNWILNDICVEIVFALSGIAVGFVLVAFLMYILQLSILPNFLFLKSSLGFFSVSFIILSQFRPV